MEVPEFWAEARRRRRERTRQVTVRRFGWSNLSQADAQAMAEARVDEAFARVLAGDKLERRERKVAYNGAKGLPIREEVLGRYGQVVITRNSYGAHCLNTPDVLFADIDFPTSPGCAILLVTGALLLCLGIFLTYSFGWLGLTASLIVVVSVVLTSAVQRIWQATIAARGGHSTICRGRVERFVARHPGWNVRLYLTPVGMRLLATHQTFDPNSAEVQEFFTAVKADRRYQQMCLRQNCFRARVTAKPWRIGISAHLRPRPGVWPVAPERKAGRDAGSQLTKSPHELMRPASIWIRLVQAASTPKFAKWSNCTMSFLRQRPSYQLLDP